MAVPVGVVSDDNLVHVSNRLWEVAAVCRAVEANRFKLKYYEVLQAALQHFM